MRPSNYRSQSQSFPNENPIYPYLNSSFLIACFSPYIFINILSPPLYPVLLFLPQQFYQTPIHIIIIISIGLMLQAYDHLKQILTRQGYESALSFVQNYPLLKTNFYCYLTIQRGFKIHHSLTILQGCLAQEHCRGAIRALTRYHICQIYFIEDLKACGEECQEIIGEFIGAYHMLKEHMERRQEDQEELVMLQYIIYYCLLLLGYLRGQEGRREESENYIQASNNLLKINNQSSQSINASNFRTKSSESKHRMENMTY